MLSMSKRSTWFSLTATRHVPFRSCTCSNPSSPSSASRSRTADWRPGSTAASAAISVPAMACRSWSCSKNSTWTTARSGSLSFCAACVHASSVNFWQSSNPQMFSLSSSEIHGCACRSEYEHNWQLHQMRILVINPNVIGSSVPSDTHRLLDRDRRGRVLPRREPRWRNCRTSPAWDSRRKLSLRGIHRWVFQRASKPATSPRRLRSMRHFLHLNFPENNSKSSPRTRRRITFRSGMSNSAREGRRAWLLRAAILSSSPTRLCMLRKRSVYSPFVTIRKRTSSPLRPSNSSEAEDSKPVSPEAPSAPPRSQRMTTTMKATATASDSILKHQECTS